MSIDAIGNFLTIIRNGVLVTKPSVIAPHSKIKFAIAQILKDEGFVRDVQVITDENGKKTIQLFLKYVNGESVIHDINRVSTPGRRSYAGSKNIKPVISGLGLSILTTDQGVISHKKAIKMSVGGEVICTVW